MKFKNVFIDLIRIFDTANKMMVLSIKIDFINQEQLSHSALPFEPFLVDDTK